MALIRGCLAEFGYNARNRLEAGRFDAMHALRGYSIDMLRDGLGRCRKCGFEGLPRVRSRYAGLGRAFGIIGLFFATLVAIEIALVFLVTAGSSTAISEVLIGTGIVTVVAAGLIAAGGSMPLRTIGGVSLRDEQRRKGESLQLFGPAAVLILFGLFVIGIGLVFGWLG